MNRLTQLSDALGKVYRVLKEHIGSGENAHREATWYTNGFLSAEGWQKLANLHVFDGTPTIIAGKDEDIYAKILSQKRGYYTFAALTGSKNGPDLSTRGIVHVTSTGTYVLGVDIDGAVYSNFYNQSIKWRGWQKHEAVFDSGWLAGTLLNGFSGKAQYRLKTQGGRRQVLIKFKINMSQLTTTTRFMKIPSNFAPNGIDLQFNSIVHAVSAASGHASCGLTVTFEGDCYLYPILGGGTDIREADGYITIDI